MVPEFTVVVRPVTTRPELILRKRFTDGTFKVEGLEHDRYQIQILSRGHASVRMDIYFQPIARDTNFRVVILHNLQDEPSYRAADFRRGSTAMLEQAVPNDAKAAYRKAVSLHSWGKLEDALVAYGESLRAFPNYIRALADIGAIYNLLDRPDAALPYLRRANSMDPSNEAVRLNLAITLLAKQRFSDSESILNDMIDTGSLKGLAPYYLAKIYFMQKKYEDAANLARRALDEDPNLLEARLLVVNLALEQKNYAAAREGLARLSSAMNNRLFTRFVDDQIASLNQ